MKSEQPDLNVEPSTRILDMLCFFFQPAHCFCQSILNNKIKKVRNLWRKLFLMVRTAITVNLYFKGIVIIYSRIRDIFCACVWIYLFFARGGNLEILE